MLKYYNIQNTITFKLLLEKKKLNELNNIDRINYINKKKIITTMKSKSTNSEYILLFDNNIISKCIKQNIHGHTLWKNEINALLKLRNIIFFPDLIAIDPNKLIIYMTYCGKTLSKKPTIPNNWKSQLKKIKKILLTKQINPNDITLDNVCVMDGVIRLIDFGLANNHYNDISKSIDKLYWIFYKISKNQ